MKNDVLSTTDKVPRMLNENGKSYQTEYKIHTHKHTHIKDWCRISNQDSKLFKNVGDSGINKLFINNLFNIHNLYNICIS